MGVFFITDIHKIIIIPAIFVLILKGDVAK